MRFYARYQICTEREWDRGDLRMQVIERGTSTPIDDAKISISYSGDPDSTVEEVNTDASGMSETLYA